jgi:hypothetical protein
VKPPINQPLCCFHFWCVLHTLTPEPRLIGHEPLPLCEVERTEARVKVKNFRLYRLLADLAQQVFRGFPPLPRFPR